MDDNVSQKIVEKFLGEFEVGQDFLKEIMPMIDEIVYGDFSLHEKKYLYRLVEDAFRRQSEIEREKQVRGLSVEHLSRQLVEKVESYQKLSFRGRMDDPRNRIARYLLPSPQDNPESEDGPFPS
jgi:hypothetical protein